MRVTPQTAHRRPNAAMIPVKDILTITGYVRRGCSPVGMKKDYQTFIDESCFLYDFIFVSAGMRGQQLKLKPDDLVLVTSCKSDDLILRGMTK